MREVLSRTRHLDPAAVWLATTDADTVVPASWLSQHVRYADSGWDAVVGTVTVTDWAQHPPEVPPLFRKHYGDGQGTHRHVHGANLGFHAGPTSPPVASAQVRLPKTTRWSSHSGPPPFCAPPGSAW